jgi:hypothetical protein
MHKDLIYHNKIVSAAVIFIIAADFFSLTPARSTSRVPNFFLGLAVECHRLGSAVP